MPCAYYAGVVLVLERCASEIDESYIGLVKDLARSHVGTIVIWLSCGLIADKKDILRLEIRVDQVQTVQKCDTDKKLLCEVYDVVIRKRGEAISL